MNKAVAAQVVGFSILFAPLAYGANNFVYTNDNPAGPNTVSAYRVADDGALTSIPGSPFATGGVGRGGGLYAANRVRARQAGQFLFVTNDGNGTVSTLSVNQSTGVLTPVGVQVPCGLGSGGDMSIALTPNNKYLICAADSTDTVTVFSIAGNGGLSQNGAPVSLGAMPDGMEVSPDGKLLAIALVNSDRVAMYQISSQGALTAAPGSPFVCPGSGPATGLDFNAASNRLFVGGAAGNTVVDVFNVAANGSLTPVAGSPFSFGAGSSSQIVQLSLDDRFLFASNQFSSSITVLNVAANGALTLRGTYSVGTGQPSGMAISQDGKFLYAASYPYYVAVMSIAPDGALTPAPGSPTYTGRPGGLESLTAYPPPGAAPPDTTAPTTVAVRSPNQPWCSSDVTVTLTATDNIAVASITYSINGAPPVTMSGASASFTLSAEGQHFITFFATDTAGNAETPQTTLVRIDRTAPSISASAGPGWYNDDVLVSFTCSDALSGIASCSGPVTLSGEGAGQSASGTATDNAGNTASTTVTGIGIDKTAPTITGERNPAANEHGWNNADVTVSFTCGDALSGVASCSDPALVSSEGENQSRTGTATDNAGNSSSATVAGISIDKTAPTIQASRNPAANAAGWNNGPVTTSFACQDALSGIASCSEAITRAAEGAGQDALGTAVDRAGNSAGADGGVINIDLTPPSIQGQRAPAANAAGWNNTPVSVSFTCSDALSGVASCSGPTTLASEGAPQSVSGQASDNAGNQASAQVTDIRLDFTPPQISAARSPLANAAGWNNGPVTVSFTCSDALSGIASCPADVALATEGVGLGASGQALDRAGNGASAGVTGVNIDVTAPVLTVPAPITAEATGPTGASVAYSASASDALSGLASWGCAPASGAVFPLGITTVQCNALDLAGNTASASFTVTVRDTTPPVVTPPANVSAFATSAAGAQVSYPAASAQDLVDGALVPTCTPASGALFAPGTTTVTCSATDAAGNTGSASFTVQVTFQTAVPFFLQPINVDGSSVFKQGSTVPVKFRLAGASAGITNLAARITIAKISNGIVGSDIEAISTSAATTGNLFRYSADGDLYIFNLGTKPLTAGTWQVRADLGDGVPHVVNVSLKN